MENMMSSSENAPLDVSSFLTSDEKVLKTDNNKEWEVYVTNKRVLLKRGGIFGKELIDATHRHISSIEYKKENPLPSIILGIVCVILALVANHFLYQSFIRISSITPIVVSAILAIVGIAIIIVALLKKPTFKIHIVGRKPITLSSRLEEIIRIVREYQEK